MWGTTAPFPHYMILVWRGGIFSGFIGGTSIIEGETTIHARVHVDECFYYFFIIFIFLNVSPSPPATRENPDYPLMPWRSLATFGDPRRPLASLGIPWRPLETLGDPWRSSASHRRGPLASQGDPRRPLASLGDP